MPRALGEQLLGLARGHHLLVFDFLELGIGELNCPAGIVTNSIWVIAEEIVLVSTGDELVGSAAGPAEGEPFSLLPKLATIQMTTTIIPIARIPIAARRP
jgi:hypothetical protein